MCIGGKNVYVYENTNTYIYNEVLLSFGDPCNCIHNIRMHEKYEKYIKYYTGRHV